MQKVRAIGTSPYLAGDHRLADVIAAIQATATYKFYKLDFSEWADRICGDNTKGDHWREVFSEHPEFFRFDSARQKASLVLRRQRPKLYNVDTEKIWKKDEYLALDDNAKLRFSRSPLTSDEISTLIDVAINLHTRSAERARDKRWWAAPVLAFCGALLGVLVPLLFK